MRADKLSCSRCCCCGTTQFPVNPGPSHNRPLYSDGFGKTGDSFNHSFCCRDDSERPRPPPPGGASTLAGRGNRRSHERPVLRQVWPEAAEQNRHRPARLPVHPLMRTAARRRGKVSTPDTLGNVAQGWALLQSCQHR